MKRLSVIFTILFLMTGILPVTAQKQEIQPVYYINVLVDADHNIYIQEKKISFDEVAKKVRGIVYNISASKYQGVVYRIYADESLKMGNIIDLGAELIRGYDPIKVERYLLNLERNNIDGSNYIKKVERLDLKAIDP